MSRRTLRALSLATTVLGLLAGPTLATAATAGTAATEPAARSTVRIGMSSPADEWSSRLSQVGGVDARRIFGTLTSPGSAVTLASKELAAGRLPVLSFKLPEDDWAGAAAGVYDAPLTKLAAQLAALPGRVFVTIHHEPAGDGTPAAYAAMQRRVLPILSPPANVDAGVIVNGFWWSAKSQGLTDAAIAEWLPPSVLSRSEVVASDTYQGGTVAAPGENAAVKIVRMGEWATRVGVQRLGVGEYNGLDAASLKAAGDAVVADPRFVFANVFNSNVNNREGIDWTLSGDRLTAFQATVQQSRTAS